MYDNEKIREVASKEEQCEIELDNPMGKSLTKSEIKELRSKYYKYCPKSKSNNIIFCPTAIIKKKNDPKLEWLNDYFKKIRKKSKKWKKIKVKKDKSKKKNTKVNMNKSKKKKKRKKRKKRKSRRGRRGENNTERKGDNDV